MFRTFHLEKGPGDACSPFAWEIRSIVNDAVVGSKWTDLREFPALGTTEVWAFVNKSGMTHPMHMHLVMFQVLDEQSFEVVEGEIVPIGAPVPPPPHEAGWKDTVQVGPNEIVRVIARFTNPLDPAGATYVGLFPYHCHILEHEDHEMMRQFQTTTFCGDGIVGRPAEQCDDGGTASGDGCSPGCQVEECSDGIDNDGDGRVDFAFSVGDPGCSSASDLSERSPSIVCDDGLDNDGDGRIDFDPATLADYTQGQGDPGCQWPGGARENPVCNDGIDNDGDGAIDCDGGVLAGLPPGTPADSFCFQSGVPACWVQRETGGGCGLGFEVALLLAPLWWLRRRERPGS